MEVLNHLGSLSGFQINWDISELMPVHLNQISITLNSVPFRVSKDRLTYLGASVTRKPGLLIGENWNLKINQLKQNIDFPQFLYIFQSIPSLIIIPFLWPFSKQESDFGLPDFKCYYWAAHLNILAFWRSLNCTEPNCLTFFRASSMRGDLSHSPVEQPHHKKQISVQR